MDQGTNSLLKGFSDSLNSYLGGQLQAQQTAQAKAGEEQIAEKKESAKQQAETERQITVEKTKSSLEDVLSPEMAESVLPGHGAQMVQQYNAQNPNKPLKLKDGVAYLKSAADALNPDTTKQDNHQDALEKDTMNRLTQVRGDQSIQRTELQRDAAGQAYDTIAKARAEGRDLTELEQNDVIGQLAKARFGTVTDQMMKEMNEKTGKRGFNHLITYMTGNPSLVGASTQKTLENLQQFVVSTGLKVDQQHDSYMTPRLIKPKGLDDDRWEHIKNVHRGTSFADQMKTTNTTYKQPQASQDGWSIKRVGQ